MPLNYWQGWRRLLWRLSSQPDVLFPLSARTEGRSNQLKDAELRKALGDRQLGVWALDIVTLDYLTDRLEQDSPQTIVECGCGASTVLFALYAHRHKDRNVAVVSLEQSSEYLTEVQSHLRSQGLEDGVHLIHAGLDDKDQYQLPSGEFRTHLAGREIDWLFIDGPSGRPGCRQHTLPLLAPYAKAGGRWFMDDAFRDAELMILANWAQQSGVEVEGILPMGKGLAVGRIRR